MKQAALIGLGMVSDTFADALARSDRVTLAAVHARSAESRAAFVARHPGPCAVARLAEVAEDPSIDFVILATPPNARSEIVATLAAAGKPILMEKPVERTLAAALSVVETCEAAGVPLGIVFQHRTRDVTRALRDRLPELGPLQAVEVQIPWWRPQGYYDQPGRGSFAQDGGGVLLTQAIHMLDLMVWLAGPVASVNATMSTTGLHRMEGEDFVSAALRFGNGAVGSLMASTASFPGRPETLTLHGLHGSARLAQGVLTLDWHDGRSETVGQDAASGAGADPMAFTSDWHRAVIEDFAATLDAGRPPLVTGRSALAVHRLIAAMETSGRTGTWETVTT